MKISLIVVLTISCLSGFSQTPRWDSTTHWTLYRIRSRDAFRLSLDSLRNHKRIELTKAMLFLKNVTPITENAHPLWMGAYAASCEMPDGSVRKILISQYGGFFFDTVNQLYYELPESIRSKWLEYLSTSYTPNE